MYLQFKNGLFQQNRLHFLFSFPTGYNFFMFVGHNQSCRYYLAGDHFFAIVYTVDPNQFLVPEDKFASLISRPLVPTPEWYESLLRRWWQPVAFLRGLCKAIYSDYYIDWTSALWWLQSTILDIHMSNHFLSSKTHCTWLPVLYMIVVSPPPPTTSNLVIVWHTLS